MLTIFFGIGFLAALIYLINELSDPYFETKGAIIWFITATVLFVPSLVLTITYTGGSEFVLKDSEEIYTLSTNIETSGVFVLGSGRIDTEPYYYYYSRKELGYKLSKIKVENTYIEFDDFGTPRIERYKTKGFAVFFDLKLKNYNIIYVPSTAIIQDYDANY